MKKLFCMLCCAMLALSAVSCALAAEAGELATATSLKAYLPTVGWDDYTATDADGDGGCDYAGTNCRFTDTDGDGVCDYAGTGSRPMDGTGRGAGYRDGRNR